MGNWYSKEEVRIIVRDALLEVYAAYYRNGTLTLEDIQWIIDLVTSWSNGD